MGRLDNLVNSQIAVTTGEKKKIPLFKKEEALLRGVEKSQIGKVVFPLVSFSLWPLANSQKKCRVRTRCETKLT